MLLALPWLRTIPGLAALPKNFRQAALGAGLMLAAVAALRLLLGHPRAGAGPAGLAGSNGFKDAVMMSGDRAAPPSGRRRSANAGAAPSGNAGSMSDAIASLEARLAKGGGSAGDWELLAKSFEFLGRPEDARKARAHQLPPVRRLRSAGGHPHTSAARGRHRGAAGTAPWRALRVSGEVSLAPALRAKAAAGATLFIVAKSVDSPGAPVAVYPRQRRPTGRSSSSWMTPSR